ncbi:tripartite tricarboxylate transporter TctB family protein [Oceanobacillus bengalensis]|uniref:Tripartite tricarboxylate transporter TctB family protein n=1 Tax=Oceanobacillus bengalensis TaxID=1435466 RepID=A0A494YSU0_9BACI|nr:tripartite tricarboxylate transporter TctB family protein [Oceanobacillus bengalensis]RKQ13198.1 tripartite tricarboxylate transporter TctB family protein [Oceanobacillus bengalensis]
MKSKDRIASIALLTFCIFFYFQSNNIRTQSDLALSSAFYPRLLLALIAILAISMLIKSFLPVKNKDNHPSKSPEQKGNGKIVWIIFLLFTIYIFSISFIGFILASFLFMSIVYLLIVGKGRPVKTHVLSISGFLIATIALTFIFDRFLGVSLPGIF